MIYIIVEPCIGYCDTSCVDVCPVDCIHGPVPLDDIREIREAGGEDGLKAQKVLAAAIESVRTGAVVSVE